MKSIICLDFDGVIHSYERDWQGAGVVSDPPVPGAFRFILNLVRANFAVHIYSSRSQQPGGIAAMTAWFNKHITVDIPPTDVAVVLGSLTWATEKPSALLTIDDRALTFTGFWPSVGQLHEFKPWNKRGDFGQQRSYRDAIAARLAEFFPLASADERLKAANAIMVEAVL